VSLGKQAINLILSSRIRRVIPKTLELADQSRSRICGGLMRNSLAPYIPSKRPPISVEARLGDGRE
jgi:hypothetical protein